MDLRDCSLLLASPMLCAGTRVLLLALGRGRRPRTNRPLQLPHVHQLRYAAKRLCLRGVGSAGKPCHGENEAREAGGASTQVHGSADRTCARRMPAMQATTISPARISTDVTSPTHVAEQTHVAASEALLRQRTDDNISPFIVHASSQAWACVVDGCILQTRLTPFPP